ncbi:MAG: uncharacterized protein JWM64_1003 [Frankiales bacterium]|nr:uncharacterized protein [Frankiales bacterium]
MTPTVERFRGLARSSPWRWDAVSFALTSFLDPVRATVVRPDRLRVVDARGRVVVDGAQAPTDRGGRRPEPALDGDGLSTAPRRVDQERDSVPMWQSYLWCAVLDPAELADGVDGNPGTDVLSVRAVVHHGREAWEAQLRPRETYAPLCGCCALLRNEVSDRYEGHGQGPYADGHRVRLDVETGICVLRAEVGGPQDGVRHDVRVTDVRPGTPRARILP